MFTVTSSWYMPVNILVLVIIVGLIIAGWVRGLLRQVISLVGTVVSYYGAWFLARILARFIHILPDSLELLDNEALSEIASRYLNEIVWMVVLFILFRIAFMIIDQIVKGIQDLPIIHEVNCFGGAFLGLVEATLIILVLSVFFSTPFFKNGKSLNEDTLIKPINNVTGIVYNNIIADRIDIDAFDQLYEDASSLSEEQKKAIEEWLKERGYEESSISPQY